MTVVLIGYRASGKTSLGQRLAEHLGLPFVDTDDLILQHFGADSVARIWQEHGEPEFRRVEVEVVRKTLAGGDQIIALGGGALTQADARQAVEQALDCTRIYLACDSVELFNRITADNRSATTRPNLTKLGGGIEEINAVLAQRQPVYQALADKTVDVTGLSLDQAFERLVASCL